MSVQNPLYLCPQYQRQVVQRNRHVRVTRASNLLEYVQGTFIQLAGLIILALGYKK